MAPLLARIFPPQFDNRYRGHKLALWLLYALTFMNLAISLVAIFSRDGGAQSADGIPLDTFGAAGANAVIGVVAFLGLANLLLCLFFLLALVRYRAMIPLTYLFLVVQYLAHKSVGWMKPIPRMATPPSGHLVTMLIFALSLLGLILSLQGQGYRSDRQPT